MWHPVPSFPKRHLITLKWILRFLNATGLFYLPSEMDHGHNVVRSMLYNFYYVIVSSWIITVTILTGVHLLDGLNDVDFLADRGVLFAALVLILFKQNIMIWNKRRIEVWVADTERRYSTASEIEAVRFAENDKSMFYYVKLFTSTWLLISASWLLPLYLGHPEEFELPSINSACFNVDSNIKYAIIYAWNTVALSLAISRVFGTDLFMIGMYSGASSRLEALGDALEKVGYDNENDLPRVDVRQFFKKSVSEHNEIVKFIGELNRVYYWSLLIHYVFVASIVAVSGFLAFISILHGNISSFVKSAMYIFGVMCENWVYCQFGDRLKSASSNVSEALWKSNWYKLAKEERLAVLLIMRASGKPLFMGARKMFRMDRERLGLIVSSAYSYFTVLRNIYN